MKNLGHLYFLEIEVDWSPQGLSLSLSQWKYLSDLLTEFGMSGSWPVDTPMDPAVRFDQNLGDALENTSKYRRLIGSLSTLLLLDQMSHLLLEY